ncbi:hypothetical protein C8R46DRAFT_34916 [Mycena filopes]|nr:hypothetical protein C8R46DRAFT_34916 [Mycena filopes]
MNAVGSPCQCPPFRTSHLFADEPRILELLRAYTLPTNLTDLTFIHGLVNQGRRELARYDAEIERVEAIFAELCSQRGALARHVDRYKSMVAPVRRLPPELLMEIFELCGHPRGADLNLLALSQVCSHWRRVAVGTPGLWSHVDVDTNSWRSSRLSAATLLGRLDDSLQRGGALPLTLCVDVGRDAEYNINVVKALIKHAPRWRSLSFSGELESFRFTAGAHGDLPLLESLDISDDGDFELYLDLPFFKGATALTDFTFTGDVARIPAVPWEQLKSFEYRTAGFTPEHAQVLSLMCRLPPDAKFSASLNTSTSGEVSFDLPVISEIGSLSLTLELCGYNSQRTRLVGEILNTLTLPRLQHLGLHHHWYTPAPVWSQPPFLDFAARSGLAATLTALNLRVIIPEDELVECLAGLPLLERLALADSEEATDPVVLSDDLLRRLTDATLTPRLRVFACSSLLRFSDEVLAEFLNARVARVSEAGADAVFEATVYRLLPHTRQLSPSFHEQIDGSVARGALLFYMGMEPSRQAPWESWPQQPSRARSTSPVTSVASLSSLGQPLHPLSTITESDEGSAELW